MKKFLSLVMALVMTMSLVTIGAGATEYQDLTDKSEIQYEEAVAVLNKLGIISGYEDGSFRPTGALTRGAAAKIIVSMMIGPEAANALTVNTAPYSDVPVTNTFAAVISYCKTAGYINGYSDGTFRPAAALTGYAFTKMLLGALGYDGAQEGFTGEGWIMNVSRLGNTAGLFNDFATAFSGNGGVDRESACLLALNTLKATQVEYTGGTNITTSTGDATTSVSTQRERSYVTSNNTTINRNIRTGDGSGIGNNYYTLEFGEEHFQDLKLITEGGAEDDFGRPSNEWSFKNAKIGTYALRPDYTYTAGASGDTNADKVRDMGLRSYKVDKDTYYVNGLETNFTASSDAGKLEEIAALTGNGVLVEAYMDEDNADTIKTFVVIYTQVMQINAVRTSEVTLKSVEGTYLTGAGSVTSVKDTDAAWSAVRDLKTDDFVLVVPVRDGNSYRAFSVAVPQSVSGSLSNIRVNTSNNEVNRITVAGTEYRMSKLWTSEDKELTSSTQLTSSVETTAYLDAYGYAIYVADVTASNSAIIIDEIYSSLVDGRIIKYAQGWDSQGNELSLNLGTSPTYPVNPGDDAAQQGMVYEYETATGNNAEYRLLNAHGFTGGDVVSAAHLVYRTGSDQHIANGEYNAIVNADGATVAYDSNVKFIFISKNGSDVTGITVKNGVSAVGDGSHEYPLTYVLNKDATRVVSVIVPNDIDAGNTANLLFFQKVTNHITNADGRRVVLFTAYIDGEERTNLELNQDVSGDSWNNQFYTYNVNESTGVYSLTPYQQTSGRLTSVTTTVDQVYGADLSNVNDYFFTSSVASSNLNARNAVVIDLDSDDGITYSSVKEMKDAIGVDTDANTGGKVTGFDVAYIYNGDAGNNGYRTVSYLFIVDTVSAPVTPAADKYSSLVDQTVTDANGKTLLDMSNTTNYNIDSSYAITVFNQLAGQNLQTQVQDYLRYMNYTNIGALSYSSGNYNVTAVNPDGITVTLTMAVGAINLINKITVDGTAKYVTGASYLNAAGVTGHARMVSGGATSVVASGALGSTTSVNNAVYTSGFYTLFTYTNQTGLTNTSAGTYNIVASASTGALNPVVGNWYLPAGAVLTLTVTPTTAVTSNTDTVTFAASTGTVVTPPSLAVTFVSGDGTNPKTVTYTAPATPSATTAAIAPATVANNP